MLALHIHIHKHTSPRPSPQLSGSSIARMNFGYPTQQQTHKIKKHLKLTHDHRVPTYTAVFPATAKSNFVWQEFSELKLHMNTGPDTHYYMKLANK